MLMALHKSCNTTGSSYMLMLKHTHFAQLARACQLLQCSMCDWLSACKQPVMPDPPIIFLQLNQPCQFKHTSIQDKLCNSLPIEQVRLRCDSSDGLKLTAILGSSCTATSVYARCTKDFCASQMIQCDVHVMLCNCALSRMDKETDGLRCSLFQNKC